MRFKAHSQMIGVRRALIAIFLGLGLSLSAARAEKVKDLQAQGYVNDSAGVLNAQTAQQITGICTEIDQRTEAQIAVVTIKTLEGLEASDFANQLFKKWGVGHKGNNRGILVLVATTDHKYWIEVGYGLEPILPDGKTGGFGRGMVPSLKAGDYDGALLHLTAQIAEVIAEDRGIFLDSLSEGYVIDTADELSPETHARITALFREVEQKAHAQVSLLTAASLAGLEPAEFASRVFAKYHVGQKDDNRGALILFLPHHEYRIEVGTGLQIVLSNEKVDGYGPEVEPFLSANDFDGAASHLAANVARDIAGERGISLSSLANLALSNTPQNPADQPYTRSWSEILSMIFVGIFVAVALVGFLLKFITGPLRGGKPGRRFYSSGDSWTRGSGGSSNGSYGSFGGGSEGSSGGSFGGFGGGSSGGGGAGGSW